MKIVVLDGHTLNPGDLSWSKLEEIAEVTVYDRTDDKDTISRAKEAEIILTNKTVLDKETIKCLPKLKYIGVLATGINVVDIEAARQAQITVTNIPGYSTNSVAQTVFAHILNLTQHVAEHSTTVTNGKWNKSPDFCYWDIPLIELADKTIGIIGFGKIGQATAKLAIAFGMKVIVSTRTNKDTKMDVDFVSIDEIFKKSDFVSINCPLTEETTSLINAEKLSLMKKTAFLINTSRGPVLNEEALSAALNNEQIAGAGLDVLSVEPASANNPLLTAKNCYITPHIAWATTDSRKRLMEIATENVKSFINKKPINVVS